MGQVVIPAVWSRARTSRRKWRWGASPVRDSAIEVLQWSGCGENPWRLNFGRTGRPTRGTISDTR